MNILLKILIKLLILLIKTKKIEIIIISYYIYNKKMLIEFNKLANFYDNLNELINNDTFEKTIVYNFIPVKILNKYYVLTCLKDLESYLIEYKENIIVKLYINNFVNLLEINSVISFTDKDYNPLIEYDCYIDCINNLVLIKFESEDLEYIEIDDCLNPENDIMMLKNECFLTYNWYDDDLNSKTFLKNSNLEFIWRNKFINLPYIPYIIDSFNDEDETDKCTPITGSAVYNLEKFIGIVSYVNDDEIIIIPLLIIKKLSNYLKGDNMRCLALETLPVEINFKFDINKIHFTNGLLICNNFYDIYKKNIKKLNKNEEDNFMSSLLYANVDCFLRNNIICQID